MEETRIGTNDKAYLHTVGAGSMAPLVQSAITGLLIGIAALVVAYTQRWREPWNWFLYASIFSTLLMWLTHQKRWFDLTAAIRQIERSTDKDIDGDGFVGEPVRVQNLSEKPRETVIRIQRIETDAGAGYGMIEEMIRLPISDSKLETFVESVLDGAGLSVGVWVGDGHLFSRPEYEAFRNELEVRGLIETKVPGTSSQGFKLSDDGELIFAEWLKARRAPHSPTA